MLWRMHQRMQDRYWISLRCNITKQDNQRLRCNYARSYQEQQLFDEYDK